MAQEVGYISKIGDSVNDIVLEMETLDDTFEKAIVRYDYPFIDGADLEDMGQKARIVKVRCWFFDSASQSNYDDHLKLIDLMRVKELLEFNHPKYGILKGKVDSVSTRHDDQQRTAVVDFSFVEQMRDSIVPVASTDVTSAGETAFTSGQGQQEGELTRDMAALGFDAGLELDPDQTLLAQLKIKSVYQREIARSLDAQLGALSAEANQVVQPVNSLVATTTFRSTLPGRVLGIMTKCVERVARLYDSSLNYPANYLRSLDAGLRDLVTALSAPAAAQTAAAAAARSLMVKHLVIACAGRIALEAAYCYADDEADRQTVRQSERNKSFDALGRYLGQPVPVVMDVRQLETTLAATRSWLQQGVDQARSMTALKGQALDLLTYVSSVKLERERIITVELDNPIPLHLVCLRYGLDYHYAERIRSINPTLANPNATSGTLQIYTPAGGAA